MKNSPLFSLSLVLLTGCIALSATAQNPAAIAAAAKAKSDREMNAALQAADARAKEAAKADQALVPSDDKMATLEIHDGDPAQFKFVEALSSKTSAIGDPVQFVLATDLSVNGIAVVRAGERALGEVVWVEKPRSPSEEFY